MSGEVGQMTSIELSRINVGKWFNRAHPALARAGYEKECVPTLAAVFRFLFDRPGIIYVELKTDGAASASTYDLVRSVNGLIGEFSLRNRVVVVSLDHAALALAKSLDPSPCTGALFEPRRANPGWRSDKMLNTAAECGADEILPHHLLARPKLIEKARIKNLPVVVWAVDEPRWLARAKTLGIHGLITNNPARMLE